MADAANNMSDQAQREAFKAKQRDAELRREGELAPQTDENSGKIINPHNPDFITKVPWYLGESGPTLQHQGSNKATHELSMSEADELYSRKNKEALALKKKAKVTKVVGFRKGACKNCGAMTHKEKDCVERPRSKKKSAWKSGLDIAPDEVKLDLADHGRVSYSAKRDSWKGYDPEQYKGTIEKFERVEEERRKIQDAKFAQEAENEAEQKALYKKEKKARRKARRQSGAESDSDSSDDSDSDAAVHGEVQDPADMRGLRKEELLQSDAQDKGFQARHARQGGVGGAQMSLTNRNLRIREDIPKYLRNLDLDSAHYDPKARSMRANPYEGTNVNPEDVSFAGDNFERITGDAVELAKAQVLAWEMQAKGQDVDVFTNPSEVDLLARQRKQSTQDAAAIMSESLINKYGNAARGANSNSNDNNTNTNSSMPPPTGTGTGIKLSKELDPKLRFGQTEVYQEYDRLGQVVRTGSSSGGGVNGKGKQDVHTRRTKYEEDVFIGNHTDVWGSYYDRSGDQWGFACCWSCSKNSYCLGEAGKTAIRVSEAGLMKKIAQMKNQGGAADDGESAEDKQRQEKMRIVRERAAAMQESSVPQGNSSSNGNSNASGKAKLKKSKYNGSAADADDEQLKEQAENARSQYQNDSSKDKKDKNRGFGDDGDMDGYDIATGGNDSKGSTSKRALAGTDDVTEEDMDEFRKKRIKADDPMAAMGDGEELLDYN